MENKNLPELWEQTSWGDRILAFSRMLGDLMGFEGLNSAINLREAGDELVLSVDIPGFDPRNLDIMINGNMVVLKGESRQEVTRDEPGYYSAMKSNHSFYRTIPLPVWVKSEQTKAQYNDGVLKLRMIKGKSLARRFKPCIISGN